MSKQIATEPLLMMKVKMPRIHADVLQRPHLLDKLRARRHEVLTLITAPAGFGKTTLAYLWAQAMACPVAWLAIDERDNDPKRFWTYLVGALQTLSPGLGKGALEVLLSPTGEQDVGLTILLNEIADLSEDIVLILDDYHLIEADTIHQGVQFFVENLPPQLHLVISSRSEPNLPLARLRARRQLLELTAADLRFSQDEMAEFFTTLGDFDLTEQQLNALSQRTEGWIAGLQMTALSMRNQEDLDSFITALTGNHHHILDYLVEEVLDQQAKDVQQFLLQTSILDSLTADLCASITGFDNAQQILNHLSQQNLFISPLDDERRWFRYHRLFAEFLRNRLQAHHPDQIPELHALAGQWFEAQGMIPESIEQWLDGQHYEKVADMIETHGAQIFWRYREWVRLHRWLDALPRDLIHGRPILACAYGWAFLLIGQPDEMLFYLDIAERAVDKQENSDVIGEVLALKAEYSMITGDFPTALDLSAQAMTYLSEDNLIIRSLGLQIQGYIYRNMGNVEQASYYLHEAHQSALRGGNLLSGIFALADLADVKVLQGRLNDANNIYEKVLRENNTSHSATPISGHIGLGRIALERNQLEQAIESLQQGIEMAQQFNVEALVRNGNTILSYALYAHGDLDEAIQACEFAVASAYRSGIERIINQSRAHQMNLMIRHGNLSSADEWVASRRLHIDETITYAREWELVVFARLLITRGEIVSASALLKRIITHAEADGRMGNVIEDLTLLAIAYEQQGLLDEACQTLARAIDLAVSERYIRVYLDGGKSIHKLLRLLASDTPYIAYISTLMDAYQETPPETVRIDGILIEDLSERELEVLRLLAVGMSNREIAEQLIIGNSTVKTHTLNIYRKLDVNNRTHAVTRAKSLKLI